MSNWKSKITESAETLADIRTRLTDEADRRRLDSLYLLKSESCKSQSAAAKEIGVHRSTIGRWLARYAEGGLEALVEIPGGATEAPTALQEHGFEGPTAIPHVQPEIDREPIHIPTAVRNILAAELEHKERFSSNEEIADWLVEHFGVLLTVDQIRGVRQEIDDAATEISIRLPLNRGAADAAGASDTSPSDVGAQPSVTPHWEVSAIETTAEHLDADPSTADVQDAMNGTRDAGAVFKPEEVVDDEHARADRNGESDDSLDHRIIDGSLVVELNVEVFDEDPIVDSTTRDAIDAEPPVDTSPDDEFDENQISTSTEDDLATVTLIADVDSDDVLEPGPWVEAMDESTPESAPPLDAASVDFFDPVSSNNGQKWPVDCDLGRDLAEAEETIEQILHTLDAGRSFGVDKPYARDRPAQARGADTSPRVDPGTVLTLYIAAIISYLDERHRPPTEVRAILDMLYSVMCEMAASTGAVPNDRSSAVVRRYRWRLLRARRVLRSIGMAINAQLPVGPEVRAGLSDISLIVGTTGAISSWQMSMRRRSATPS